MKVIADTNIIISALINAKGKEADIILSPSYALDKYTCHFLYDEILKHKAKILKAAGIKEAEFLEVYFNINRRRITLFLLPVTILEIVWVLEKVYKLEKKAIRELAEAIINTPQLKIELGQVFRKALRVYEEKNVKFADAVMGYWGLEKGLKTVFTYNEKDFKRIGGLQVKTP